MLPTRIPAGTGSTEAAGKIPRGWPNTIALNSAMVANRQIGQMYGPVSKPLEGYKAFILHTFHEALERRPLCDALRSDLLKR
jgi:hypothetical protein